jgi:glutathione synthase/RimK-type ligase-like ATP-grasp enzyme
VTKPDVLLATCRDQPQLTSNDQLLQQALEARGAVARPVPWDGIQVDGGPPTLVCLRSTWDYHRRWSEFRQWIQGFASRPGLLWNPPSTVLWNADKDYLRELSELGLPLPPTQWCEPGERPDLEAFLRQAGAGSAVLKPRVSATAYGTHLVVPGIRLDESAWAHLEEVGSLVQAFVSEIAQGEASLIYIDGEFSHAVLKRPTPGEFRVQHDFGGRVEGLTPAASLRGLAERVLRSISFPWLYARVDVAQTSDGPVLMEVELIEPDLFLDHAPNAADRLAAALIERTLSMID